MSLNLKPPSFFGLAMFFQEIQDIFLVSGAESHQNLVNIDWIWAQSDRGSLKHDIACVGMEARTVLSIIILPARERNFEDQLIDFSLMRPTIPAKMSFLRIPNYSGSPRYFPKPPSFSIPSVCLIWSFLAWLVLRENEIADFWVLISWPDTVA